MHGSRISMRPIFLLGTNFTNLGRSSIDHSWGLKFTVEKKKDIIGKNP